MHQLCQVPKSYLNHVAIQVHQSSTKVVLPDLDLLICFPQVGSPSVKWKGGLVSSVLRTKHDDQGEDILFSVVIPLTMT